MFTDGVVADYKVDKIKSSVDSRDGIVWKSHIRYNLY